MKKGNAKTIEATVDAFDLAKIEKRAKRRGQSVGAYVRAVLHEAVYAVPLTADEIAEVEKTETEDDPIEREERELVEREERRLEDAIERKERELMDRKERELIEREERRLEDAMDRKLGEVAP